MSVQKKSLIGSRPAEKKATTKPVRGTEAIGAAKTANVLAPRTFYKAALKPSFRFRTLKSTKR